MWFDEVKTKDGTTKYKFVERYFDVDGKQKYVSVTLKTNSTQSENKARKILAEKIAEKTSAEPLKQDISVKNLSEEWMKIKQKTNLKPSTITAYNDRTNQINKKLGSVMLSKLTAGRCNKMFNEWMVDDNLNFRTVEERMKVIKLLIKYAIENDYLKEDRISSKLKVEKINVSEKREDKYLEKDEEIELFNKLLEGNYHKQWFLFSLMIQTGMRYNEASAIHLDQVDLKNKTILIDKQYNRINQTYTLPKSNKVRMINISDATIKLIKNQIKKRKEFMMVLGIRNCELLIFNEKGNPVDITYSNELLHSLEPEGKEYTTHIFRHTFITRMVENHVPAKLIAEHVGHANTNLIERVYSHFSEKMNNELKEAINTYVV